MTSTDEVLYEVDGHVATVTLNRPDRMNTITTTMLSAFAERIREADRDPGVRVIVVTGAGRAFCAGLDLTEAAAGGGISGGAGAAGGRAGDVTFEDSPPVVLHRIDTPTICALNGGAAGYGLDLALGCDIRIAAEGAKLAASYTRRGVLPESGGTWILPRLVGWARAAELMFTGRTLTADEALGMGLVNRVVPADALAGEVGALAGEIASAAPLAVRAAKRMMRAGLEETFEDHVHHVYLQLLPLFASADFREAVSAFVERRDPTFEGR